MPELDLIGTYVECFVLIIARHSEVVPGTPFTCPQDTWYISWLSGRWTDGGVPWTLFKCPRDTSVTQSQIPALCWSEGVPGTLFKCPRDTSVTQTQIPALCWSEGVPGTLFKCCWPRCVRRIYLKAANCRSYPEAEDANLGPVSI